MKISSSARCILILIASVLLLVPIEAFIQRSTRNSVVRYQYRAHQSTENDDAPPSITDPSKVFPVISKIAGLEWTGSCRYINTQLMPMSNLKLSGGTKYEIDGTSLKLSSFLTFPNGKTREVVMMGERSTFPPEHEVITLESIDEEGPIIMKLSEVYPDTIIINEEERATGKTIMTSSVSIVQGRNGMELVGVSHEVGDEMKNVIEGHQIWRMTVSSSSSPVIKYNDFDEVGFRDTTGR